MYSKCSVIWIQQILVRAGGNLLQENRAEDFDSFK